MRKFTFTIPTLLFSCLLLAGAALADVTTFQSRGKLAYATYYQYTDGYSKALAVDVFVSEAIIQIGTNRTFTPQLFVQIYGINYATEPNFFFMSGETNQFVFTVRGDLAAAEVSGNVVVMDSLGNSKQVSLALSFQGGALTRAQAHYGWSSGLSRTV